jgi:hypothetical protein
MRASAIKELAASRASTRIAATFSEHTVQIWDVRTGERLAEFETVFSSGGHRVTIDPSGERCVAAGWSRGSRGGVACYIAASGALQWHRIDLRQTQRVRFSPSGTTIWHVPEAGSATRLDALTGDTLDNITGLSDIYESSYCDGLLLEEQA